MRKEKHAGAETPGTAIASGHYIFLSRLVHFFIQGEKRHIRLICGGQEEAVVKCGFGLQGDLQCLGGQIRGADHGTGGYELQAFG